MAELMLQPANRILALGVGPLPVQSSQRLYAPGLRTWSFARALANDGAEVVCASADFGGIDESAPLPGPTSIGAGRVTFAKLSFDLRANIKKIRALHASHQFDAAVSTTDLMNRALAQAHLPIPVWLDFNGPPMVERQMQAAVYESDGGVKDAWDMMLPSLMFGDRFSSCGAPHKHALVGELGAVGRLNRHTAHDDLIAPMLPALYERKFYPSVNKVIRGQVCGDDAFVLLWTGGYNTWTDVRTLFIGLEMAMQSHEKFHYVSTGGAIAGHDELTFKRFMERVEQSPHRDRYHFAGWVHNDKMADYYAECDAAINLDSTTYEAMLGHRNRIQEWVMAEVPVISTPLCELARRMSEERLLTPIQPENPTSLAKAIDQLIEHPHGARERTHRAQIWMKEQYAPIKALEPLLEWRREPRPAPDLPPPQTRGRLKWHGPDNPFAMAQRTYMKRNRLL